MSDEQIQSLREELAHFQFWILNSIEFRLNDLARKMQTLTEKLDSN